MGSESLQFKEMKQVVIEMLREAKELDGNLFHEKREEISHELLTYRLLSKLENLGWVQLADEPTETS